MSSGVLKVVMFSALLVVLLIAAVLFSLLMPSGAALPLWLGIVLGTLGSWGTVMLTRSLRLLRQMPEDRETSGAGEGVLAQMEQVNPWGEEQVMTGQVFTYPGRVLPSNKDDEEDARQVPEWMQKMPAFARMAAAMHQTLDQAADSQPQPVSMDGSVAAEGMEAMQPARKEQRMENDAPVSGTEEHHQDEVEDQQASSPAETEQQAPPSPSDDSPLSSSSVEDQAPWWQTRRDSAFWVLGRSVTMDDATPASDGQPPMESASSTDPEEHDDVPAAANHGSPAAGEAMQESAEDVPASLPEEDQMVPSLDPNDVPRLPLDDPLDEGRSYRSLLEEFSDLRRHREELPAMDFPWEVDRSIPSRPMVPPKPLPNIFDAAAWGQKEEEK